MPIGWAVTVVVLCVAVIVLAVVVLGLMRQVTPVLERAATLQGGMPPVGGPPTGRPLPHFAARGPDGEVASEQLRGGPTVLLFLSRGCGPCRALAQEMAGAGLGDLLSQIVVIGNGSHEELGLPTDVRLLIESNHEVQDALSIQGTPMAVAVDPEGIVRSASIANTVEQLRELTAAAAQASL